MNKNDVILCDKYNTLYDSEGKLVQTSDMAILSGSFNPLHLGHLAIIHYIEEYHPNKVPVFEMTQLNCDKGVVSDEEIEQRVRQFDKICRPVFITHRPNFVEKSYYFKGAMFCVGSDTIIRVNKAQYYYNDEKERNRCCIALAKNGCSFIIFERDGLTLADIENSLCDELRAICKPAIGYKSLDISSTQIRARKK